MERLMSKENAADEMDYNHNKKASIATLNNDLNNNGINQDIYSPENGNYEWMNEYIF